MTFRPAFEGTCKGPSVYKLQVSMTQAEIAIIRKVQQPDESATAAIRRLALERAKGGCSDD